MQARLALPRVLSLPSLSGFRDLARESFGSFEELESLANGLPILTRNVRQTVSELTAQVAAVRASLVAALPVLNLPDWGLGMAADAGASAGAGLAPTWQERLGAFATSVVQHMELDTLFVRPQSVHVSVCGKPACMQSADTAWRRGAL